MNETPQQERKIIPREELEERRRGKTPKLGRAFGGDNVISLEEYKAFRERSKNPSTRESLIMQCKLPRDASDEEIVEGLLRTYSGIDRKEAELMLARAVAETALRDAETADTKESASQEPREE